MHLRFALLTLIFLFTACIGGEKPSPTSTPEPTTTPAQMQSPIPAHVTLKGPTCPDGFREMEQVDKDVAVNVTGVITLTLGSTPSIPCGWQAAEISDSTVIRQVDHQSQWPAEDVTPKPGAPGTETWVFKARQAGASTISLDCTCLGEEGTGEELAGILTVSVIAK